MAILRETENQAFRDFIKSKDSLNVDEIVIRLNTEIESKIDCTECGACCSNLMINITEEECSTVSKNLQLDKEEFKLKFVESGSHGMMIMNTIPCHFLCEKKCTIYENRFTDCRAFPNLDQPNFSSRLFATLVHYGMCPIIFNVVEQLKIETNFFNEQ
jgi:Fe-S-cluster containining protein